MRIMLSAGARKSTSPLRGWRWAVPMLVAVAAAITIHRMANKPWESLKAREAAGHDALPDGTVLLDTADAKSVSPPLLLEPSGENGKYVLRLPDRGGKLNEQGKALLELCVPGPGTYAAWARVRWNDACGNSMMLSVEDGPDVLIGQDAVYGTWHWVRAGSYTLEGDVCDVLIKTREDGIKVSALLFTPDDTYIPTAGVTGPDAGPDLRRAQDRFDRSPGHGLSPWRVVRGHWSIGFSLDPNRIPNQYALLGRPKPADREALIMMGRDAWNGCRMTFSVNPLEDSRFGALMHGGQEDTGGSLVLFSVADQRADLHVTGENTVLHRDLGHVFRTNQWHQVVIERWAGVLRVRVDQHDALHTSDMPFSVGRIGLVVQQGHVAFDDVALVELPWQAEQAGGHHIPWTPSAGSRWYRARPGRREQGLLGRQGRISTQCRGLPVREVVLADPPGARCEIDTTGLEPVPLQDAGRAWRARGPQAPRVLSLSVPPDRREARLHSIAVCYGAVPPEEYRDGPYHFTEAKIEDPSDYLDFTEEEYRQIAASADVGKLRRKPKFNPLVGKGRAVWRLLKGEWSGKDGCMQGVGPDGAVRFWQHVHSPFALSMRCRLLGETAADCVIHQGEDGGRRVRLITSTNSAADRVEDCLTVDMKPDRAWHRLELRAAPNALHARLDDGAWRQIDLAKGLGSSILLEVRRGTAQFDDILFKIPRNGPHHAFYAFDRRETDWWREGGRWIDHAGVACVMASNWISLDAEKQGTLWNKRRFSSDLLVAFNIEEFTEWYGWDQKPSHAHLPFDNIRIELACEDRAPGYRLDINAQDRTKTLLYRRDELVQSVPQDDAFPMKYVGGHAPYRPRRNHVCFVKSGNTLRALINGKQVLEYTDNHPLPVRRVGLGGYETHVNFSRIEICELGHVQADQ